MHVLKKEQNGDFPAKKKLSRVGSFGVCCFVQPASDAKDEGAGGGLPSAPPYNTGSCSE